MERGERLAVLVLEDMMEDVREEVREQAESRLDLLRITPPGECGDSADKALVRPGELEGGQFTRIEATKQGVVLQVLFVTSQGEHF